MLGMFKLEVVRRGLSEVVQERETRCETLGAGTAVRDVDLDAMTELLSILVLFWHELTYSESHSRIGSSIK